MTFASNTWALLKATVTGFIDDNVLSRGASIAYYTLFSLTPVLLIIVAIAGLVFGHDAAEGASVGQLNGLMGDATAKALEQMIKSADNRADGIVAMILGIAALIATVTGVFGEVQSSMNAIWKAKSEASTLSRLVRARLASLGLVATCGFLLTVSLVVAPAWRRCRSTKGGKYLIALYVGQSNVGSSYGAAGALIVVLLWIYYTAQIFLLGSEFTRAFAKRHGSHVGSDALDEDHPPLRTH